MYTERFTMNQKIGTCALCKRENIERRQSHIIPKGVYRRSRIKENSHFKNHFHPEEIFQDGEKIYMLCGDCEKFFTSYETPFFNTYLNKYLRQPSFSLSNPSAEIEFYFLTVAWRVLYDDLYECCSLKIKQSASCLKSLSKSYGNICSRSFLKSIQKLCANRTLILLLWRVKHLGN